MCGRSLFVYPINCFGFGVTGWCSMDRSFADRVDLERRSASDLKFYAGQRGFGFKPVDVKALLGKMVSVYQLSKAELVELFVRHGVR